MRKMKRLIVGLALLIVSCGGQDLECLDVDGITKVENAYCNSFRCRDAFYAVSGQRLLPVGVDDYAYMSAFDGSYRVCRSEWDGHWWLDGHWRLDRQP